MAERMVPRERLVAEAAGRLEYGWRLALVAATPGRAFRIRYVFLKAGEEPAQLVVRVPLDDLWIPSLADLSYSAGRFEREMHDLYGIRPEGHPLPVRLVKHAHWPEAWAPGLGGPAPELGPDVSSYPFQAVEGRGVYEIAVGPVHAGIIEPGHFRFSVVGETILRMEPRLWFLHRGVEKAFEGRTAADGVALAERIAGDTSVGHALAFVLAVEGAAGVEVAEPVRLARALLLELERMCSHVTDLGALANDAGFAIGSIHFQRLRERLVRLNAAATGSRLLRGAVGIGGVRLAALPDAGELARVAAEVAELAAICRDHGIVQDRLAGTGTLPEPAARSLGVLGYVARASGIDADARRDHPWADLGPQFRVVTEGAGDVLARWLVREREFAVSAAVAQDLAARLSTVAELPAPERAEGETKGGAGLGIVEAWRGTLLHHVELGAGGVLRRVKVVDPSFFGWSGLPVALGETIVPDFPLTNKSFNQSYAGNDL